MRPRGFTQYKKQTGFKKRNEILVYNCKQWIAIKEVTVLGKSSQITLIRWTDKSSMDYTRLADPYFILRFWTPRGDTSSEGHVSYAQDDGTYISGHWLDGMFVRSKNLWEDVERMGSGPTLTLKLFYHGHLPNTAAVKTWMRNVLIGQSYDPEVTCSSLIYSILQKGGSLINDSNIPRVTPTVLRELVFEMIRNQDILIE